MPRRTTVTLAATAVTLACVGATLWASPQVISQSLGRDVSAFAPGDPSTYPGAARDSSQLLIDAAAAPREYSTFSHDERGASQSSQQPDAVVSDDGPTYGISGSTTGEPSAAETTPVEDAVADAEPSPTEAPALEALPEPAVDSPDSMTVIVNKLRPLPADYAPDDLVELPAELGVETYQLRQAAADAAEDLFAAAAADAVELTVVSAYRSYAYQEELYNGYVAQHGTQRTDEMSARPGYSEHQTGLALDIDAPGGAHTLRQSFGQTAAGQWLAEHASDYGFVIRYPQDSYDVTGFAYEPWHLRYFGEQYAAHIMEHSGVAETAFELPAAPDYAD